MCHMKTATIDHRLKFITIKTSLEAVFAPAAARPFDLAHTTNASRHERIGKDPNVTINACGENLDHQRFVRMSSYVKGSFSFQAHFPFVTALCSEHSGSIHLLTRCGGVLSHASFP